MGRRRDWLLNQVTDLEDPVSLGTYDYNGGEQIIRFGDNVPSEAQIVLIECFTRCGNEAPSRNFSTRVWILGDDFAPTCHRHIFGARYGQNSISFSQVTMELPVSRERAFHVISSDVQARSHRTEFFLCGWM